jgi:hypothetical protein
MTSPQDPNQPVEPGASAPGDAAPQGWGQPPQASTPWGAPPPDASQPGWAAPPPPAQPGWGAPPPAAQPGWGQPPAAPQGWGQPPAGGQPGWGQPQPGWGQPPQKKGHGCLIAFLIVLAVIVVGAGSCTVLALPYIQTIVKLQQDLGTRDSSISFNNTNGNMTWVIHLSPGNDSQADAAIIACTIVRPDLRGTQFSNSDFELIDSDGFLVADNNTVCP